MEFILKRDGRKVPFRIECISRAIMRAEKEADEKISEKTIERIAEIIVKNLEREYKENIPTVEQVQDAVVHELIHEGYIKVAEKYISYRNERSRIRDSKSRLMKNIGEITFSDSSKVNIKRENANIDGNTAMGTMLQYGSAVSKEFCLSHVINPVFAKMHNEGDIHIHDMDFMNMGTLTCCQIDLEALYKNGFNTGHGYIREPQDIMTYAALAAIAIQSNQNDQHGGQSVPAFDYYLAAGVKKTFIKHFFSNLSKAIELDYNEEMADRLDAFAKEHQFKDRLHPSIHLNHEFESLLRGYLCLDMEIEEEKIEKYMDFAYRKALLETDKATFQAMEGFVHNLNTMHSRAGAQVPFSSINFGTDTSDEGRMVSKNLLLAQEKGLGNGETPIFPILIFKIKEGINYNPCDPNYDLFQLACRVSAKRLFPNFSFIDSPFNFQYYRPGNPNTEIAYMGCRTRVAGNVNGEEIVTGRGNLSFTSINLPRIGIEHGEVALGKFDKEGFFSHLDSVMNTCIDQLLERVKIQASKTVKNFPFLMGQGVWLGSEKLSPTDNLEEMVKQGTLSVGFIGLAECLVACIGKHHGESDEAQQLGLEIISFMRKKMDEASEKYKMNFSLLATPAEGLSGRFVKIDQKKYGIIDGVTDREYYTNSFHVPVYYPISAFDKIKKEAPYHELTNGGHISYVELDGDPSKNLEAFEMLVRCMKENGIGYGSINHPVDRDPVCGYSGVIEGNICPKCGRNVNENDISVLHLKKLKRGGNQ